MYAWRYHGNLDFEKMNEAASCLFRYTDFTSFSKLHTDVKTNNCRIMKACWKKENDLWVFEIKADRFLRNMVRAIVGTLYDVGRGRLSVGDFCRVIEDKNRCKAGTSAPGNALFLVNIEYFFRIFYIHKKYSMCNFSACLSLVRVRFVIFFRECFFEKICDRRDVMFLND